MSRLSITCSLLFAALAGACSDVDSPTDLNPEGPPMIRQVFMTERVTSASGNPVNAPALAFGSHDEFQAANMGDDGVVENGLVATTQKIRIVMDELLIGNYLEEILCRDDCNCVWDRVPEGATPDDIARCAGAQDILPETCTGKFAVCMDGEPGELGIMDTNEDGAVDDTRLIEGAVRIVCDNIPADHPQFRLSQQLSYYQPSGNQQVPAAGGFNALGPAIVLQTVAGFPTSAECRISFDSSVVDKDHLQVCAPEGGDINAGCEPGDTSLVTWRTEPLRVAGSNPPADAEGVLLTNTSATFPCPADMTPCARATVTMNTQITADPVTQELEPGAVQLFDGSGVEVTGLRIRRFIDNPTQIEIFVPGGYNAGETYTLHVNEPVKDQFGISLPEDQVRMISFTTVDPAAN